MINTSFGYVKQCFHWNIQIHAFFTGSSLSSFNECTEFTSSRCIESMLSWLLEIIKFSLIDLYFIDGAREMFAWISDKTKVWSQCLPAIWSCRRICLFLFFLNEGFVFNSIFLDTVGTSFEIASSKQWSSSTGSLLRSLQGSLLPLIIGLLLECLSSSPFSSSPFGPYLTFNTCSIPENHPSASIITLLTSLFRL